MPCQSSVAQIVPESSASVQLCVLASGSTGNAILVRTASTALLVDAGISAKAMAERLAGVGLAPDQVQAVCLSHEHDDHTRGLAVLSKRYRWPVYANRGTIEGLHRHPRLRDLPYQVFSTGSPFTVGDLAIEPFPVPHDAFEPVGFALTAPGGLRIGIATDVGIPTSVIRDRLQGCRLLVVEANHDDELLTQAPRPWHLKQRIRGRQGHLSNHTAAAMIADVAHPGLSHVYLAHLSRDCNREHLALHAARTLLERRGFGHIRVLPTYPDRVSEIWTG
ncbi:MAG: MBL fold metallo-hydrolase [Anaerolineae bacterium]